jgi:hypothetical protein
MARSLTRREDWRTGCGGCAPALVAIPPPPSVTGYACKPLDQRFHSLIWLATPLPLSQSVHS